MQGKKRIYTESELKWLTAHYKHTKNDDIVARLDISHASLHRLARKLGLKKSKQFVNKCLQDTVEAAIRSHRRNSTYPKKGFVIPNREQYQFRKGESLADRIGKRRAAEVMKRAHDSRMKTWRSEKARATFGLPQRTKLHVIPVPPKKIKLRCYLKSRGYIVDDVQRKAFYTPDTKRGKRIEAKPQPWYKFEELTTINN